MASETSLLVQQFDKNSLSEMTEKTCTPSSPNCVEYHYSNCPRRPEIRENGTNETWLFEPQLLKNIPWSEKKTQFRDDVSPTNPGDGLLMRPLCYNDYDRGFLDLLSQLTVVGPVSKKDFNRRFAEMKECKGNYFVTVIEDENTNRIIGCASLVLEHKFIHNTGQRGRIEDVVVSKEYRGRQLGKLLVEAMTLLGKSLGVYKMSLECTTEKIDFYEAFGYNTDGNNYLVQRYDK